ncbi:hypothetical protein MtrunA17_Chr3g0084391 [Medicago truncatula]|uniref:Uncharacterized protein n=1 Tax=Medicago truncatula TaxID=3880 RepID=A0A396IJK0_MEDTR|nr:hypothetical protein MtrunA17_Chr3g0084391 [Medicago truncatula]
MTCLVYALVFVGHIVDKHEYITNSQYFTWNGCTIEHVIHSISNFLIY